MVDEAYFHLPRFAGSHYVTVWVKGRPPFINTVVGIIPREEIAENLGALGVLRLKVGEFSVREPKYVRHMLVNQPGVLGQFTYNLETSRVA